MPWLFADRTPLLLTLLFALLTWQAGELFAEVRSGKAIIYNIENTPPDAVSVYDRSVAVRLENPSRSQVAGPFSFTLRCKEKGCLTGKATAIVEEPTFPSVMVEQGDSQDMSMIRATLPPGAVAWLVAETAPRLDGQEPEVRGIFQTTSGDERGQAADKQPPRVILGSSLEAWIVGGWVGFLFFGIGAVLLAIVVWLVLAVWNWRKATYPGQTPAMPALSGSFELSDAKTELSLSELKTSVDQRLTDILAKLDDIAKGDSDHAPKVG